MAEENDSMRDERKPLDATNETQPEAPALDESAIPRIDDGESVEQYSRKTFEEAEPPYRRDADPDAPEPQRRRGDDELRGRPANMYSRPERRDASQRDGQRSRAGRETRRTGRTVSCIRRIPVPATAGPTRRLARRQDG